MTQFWHIIFPLGNMKKHKSAILKESHRNQDNQMHSPRSGMLKGTQIKGTEIKYINYKPKRSTLAPGIYALTPFS